MYEIFFLTFHFQKWTALLYVRFLFPPLLNLVIFFFFLKSQDGQSWYLQDGTNQILLYPILKLQFPFLILLVFLFTAIRVPVSVRSPMPMSCGDHLPCLLAISTIASLILAPSLFLVVYLCLIILSLFYVTLTSLFKRCCNGHAAVIASAEPHEGIQNLQPGDLVQLWWLEVPCNYYYLGLATVATVIIYISLLIFF